MAWLTTGKPPLNFSAIQYRMKMNRPAIFHVYKALQPVLTKAALGIAFALASASCAGPERARQSAVPPAYSEATYRRPAGVQNTPYNTGNPPADLDPHTVHWGDVRPNY
jgi:hypothetical protein